ncbi:MAG TPA: HAD-IIB family hydrolase [Deferrisomatales bacterium]|nr:HAD-IIB family hydrolase [Deferrisomatales bacterium]
MGQVPGGVPDGVVFTDLDGTLLDHHSYRYDAALPALRELARRGVPVVLCSSKTRAEMAQLQAELGIDGPLIVENGGGVFAAADSPWAGLLPQRHGGLPARVFGTAYPALREGLASIREVFGSGVRGFGDTDPAGVAAWTGLPPRQAELAWQREFDEPFLWDPEPAAADLGRARQRLAAHGLQLTRGGRFWHVLGDNDKGRAVSWLLERWMDTVGGRPPSLGLGDSENDLPMLGVVDRGVLVERRDGTHLAPRPPGVKTVSGQGPVGWNRAVLEWLESLPAA